MGSYKKLALIASFIAILILPLPLAYYKVLDLAQTGVLYLVLLALYTTIVQYLFNMIFDERQVKVEVINGGQPLISVNKNNLIKEAQGNFEILLLLENWAKASLFEQSWKDMRDKTKELKFVYYSMYKNGLSKTFNENEASLIIDTNERLMLLHGLTVDSLTTFKENKSDHSAYANTILGGKFRREICDLIKEMEKCLLLLDKGNEDYITSTKLRYSCNI